MWFVCAVEAFEDTSLCAIFKRKSPEWGALSVILKQSPKPIMRATNWMDSLPAGLRSGADTAFSHEHTCTGPADFTIETKRRGFYSLEASFLIESPGRSGSMEHENAAAIERVSLLIKRARVCVCPSVCVMCIWETEREKKSQVRPSVFCGMGTAASESLVRPAAQSLLMMKKNHTPIYTGREECWGVKPENVYGPELTDPMAVERTTSSADFLVLENK